VFIERIMNNQDSQEKLKELLDAGFINEEDYERRLSLFLFLLV